MRIRLVAIGLLCLFLQSLSVQAAGPLVGTSLNGTPLADQFPGADICAQINAAALSLGSTGGIVDATHFTGTLTCGVSPNPSIDPSAGVTAPVVVEIGDVTIRLNAPWNITNPRFKLHGSGPGHSGIQYIGGSTAAIITLGPDPGGNFTDGQLEGFHIWGNGSNATDGVLLSGVGRSQLRDLSIWAVAGCGLHVEFGVTDTFVNIHVTYWDAKLFNMDPTASPVHGLCLDSTPGSPKQITTDGTVIDAVVEGVSGSGWYLPAAATMHFSAGTSESNQGHGIEVAQASFLNTFTSSDLEANTQGDVLDNGSNNVYINPVSISNFEFGSTARYGQIVGGGLNKLQIDAGAVAISLQQTALGNNGGTLVNNGNGGINAAGAGSAAMSTPVTTNGAIALDPVSDLFSVYYFAAGSTVKFNQASPVTAGQPWKAVFVGYWANNYEGGLLNPPAEVTEVTSASPVLNVGSIPLTFSVNSSGYLQAVNGNGSFAAEFSGHVIVLPENNLQSAPTHSISVGGTVSAVAVETTKGTPASSSAACEPNSMWADANYIYVCVATNTIKRVVLSAF